MNAADVIARYESALDSYAETVTITRGATSVTARAKLIGFRGDALIGSVIQGETRIKVLAADVVSIAPLLPTDRVSFRGQQRAVTNVDNNTGRVAGTLIYAVLTVSGGA